MKEEIQSLLLSSHQYPQDNIDFDGIRLHRIYKEVYTTEREADNEAKSFRRDGYFTNIYRLTLTPNEKERTFYSFKTKRDYKIKKKPYSFFFVYGISVKELQTKIRELEKRRDIEIDFLHRLLPIEDIVDKISQKIADRISIDNILPLHIPSSEIAQRIADNTSLLEYERESFYSRG